MNFFTNLFKNGFSLSSFGGVSVSSSGGKVKIKGSVLSVSYNNQVLLGDPSLPPQGSNSISQSSGCCDLKIKGGHVVVRGKVEGLTVNGKTLV